ncbi:MAG: peptidylprolyl isomerase [Thermosynechococcaceae cyanobacterium]
MNLNSSVGTVAKQLLAISLVMTLMACAPQADSPNSGGAGGASGLSPAQAGTPETPVPGAQPPAAIDKLAKLQGKATVEMKVKGQAITIEVDGNDAPVTAGNFVALVDQGFYNGTSFHRVVRQPQPFVVQGGDPQSKDPNVPVQALGSGGYVDPTTKQKREIPLEILPVGGTQPIYGKTLKDAGQKEPKLKHRKGAVAMARSPLPDSASSQFYFTLSDLPFLDGDYAVFAYVTKGMDVVDQIQQGDRIESATVVKGIENLKR